MLQYLAALPLAVAILKAQCGGARLLTIRRCVLQNAAAPQQSESRNPAAAAATTATSAAAALLIAGSGVSDYDHKQKGVQHLVNHWFLRTACCQHVTIMLRRAHLQLGTAHGSTYVHCSSRKHAALLSLVPQEARVRVNIDGTYTLQVASVTSPHQNWHRPGGCGPGDSTFHGVQTCSVGHAGSQLHAAQCARLL